jgi:hypothetical protein
MIFILFSCSKDFNPIFPVSEDIIIGKIGTERKYIITEKWLNRPVATPFIIVPDSLQDEVSISQDELADGIVIITEITERITPMDQTIWDSLDIPIAHSELKYSSIDGHTYNLESELKALMNNENYQPINVNQSEIWYETTNALYHMTNDSESSNLLPWIKKPMQLNSTWICQQDINPQSGEIYNQLYAKVLSQENVTVMGETLLAYKVSTSYDENRLESSGQYEYYVPDIGLVLYTSDRIAFRTTISSSGDAQLIKFHKKVRKELVSAQIVR